MRLWRKAAGALKDHSSIWRCSVNSSSSSSSSSTFSSSSRRRRELEAMIIKATSHDETRMDYKNAERLLSWIRDSPDDVIKPVVYILSMRLQKTRSWVVALKALILFHGLLRFNDIPHIHNLGRLPFDLSTFTDAFAGWGYNALVRAYFAFLDHKSTSLSLSSSSSTTSTSIITRLLSLHHLLHSSLELLLQVRPHSSAMIQTRAAGRIIILEAMDCILMEIFDVYTGNCACLKKLVSPTVLHQASNTEAVMVIEALQQSNGQGEELHHFFEFYDKFGLLNESGGFPKIQYVTEDEISQVQRIAKQNSNFNNAAAAAADSSCQMVVATVTTTTTTDSSVKHQRLTSTIITEKWEVFDEDDDATSLNIPSSVTTTTTTSTSNDSLAPSQLSLLVPSNIVHVYKHEIPDFITF